VDGRKCCWRERAVGRHRFGCSAAKDRGTTETAAGERKKGSTLGKASTGGRQTSHEGMVVDERDQSRERERERERRVGETPVNTMGWLVGWWDAHINIHKQGRQSKAPLSVVRRCAARGCGSLSHAHATSSSAAPGPVHCQRALQELFFWGGEGRVRKGLVGSD